MNKAPLLLVLLLASVLGAVQPRHHPKVHKRTGLVYAAGKPQPLTSPDARDARTVALEFVRKINPTDYSEWIITDLYSSNSTGATHVYLRQKVRGFPVANGNVNININRKGQVVSFGDSSFMGTNVPRYFYGKIAPVESLRTIARELKVDVELNVSRGIPRSFPGSGISLDDIPFELALLQVDGTLRLTHNMVIRTIDHWFDVHVDANSGEIHAMFDWSSDSVFDVYGIPVTDPLQGARQKLQDPEDRSLSPLGWNCQDLTNCYTTTIGNNVYAQTNPTGGSSWLNNYRPDGGQSLNFDFPVDFTKDPSIYKDAAVSNLFYWNNIMHDVFYAAGFDEVSGNFQENNFGKGGKGVDAVQANAQDGSGFNNANFATPPDGQRPRMRMYLWNAQKPYRDGDLDSGIIVHEYGHGISTRLTGGPANSNCLQDLQSGGMGEGWGDWWAVCFQMKSTNKALDSFPMGAYANWGKGIRPFPYSTDFTKDPQTFGYLNQAAYKRVHDIGSVWATILNEVFWEFVKNYGFNPNWYGGSAGNNFLFQDVVDGLKLQPCNPDLVEARDAIILADTLNYEGAHVCDIWRGFARRGLGVTASVQTNGNVKENFDLPNECK
jgi:extracellular elastinolytic metalloproteinase